MKYVPLLFAAESPLIIETKTSHLHKTLDMRRALHKSKSIVHTSHQPQPLLRRMSTTSQPHLQRETSLPSPPYTPKKPPTISPITGLAFWNTHLPPSQHTDSCPPYLRYAYTDHRDRACLATYDADHTRTSWADVQTLIRNNELDGFRRVPSELRKYREWSAKLIEEHGSIMNFVLSNRLHWSDLTPSGAAPFTDPDDHKILLNDWPYGIDTRITHLVVWTKFELTPEPITMDKPKGDLTPTARKQIQDFVDEIFGEKCGRENVIWFKNWSALKSVHGIEHFHVMILDPEPGFIRGVTSGDVALADLV